MRALLTGGAGFVGQWLARSLLARGDAVDLAGLDQAFTGPSILSADERKMPESVTRPATGSSDTHVPGMKT